MKRLILFLCLMMFGIANADFLGVKQASETISFFIKEPIDSAYGIPRLPDSVHIMTYADNASAATFQTRSTTYPFSDVSIDTLKIYGDTVYVFADQIQDIDGAGGNFELAIVVKMFTNGYYLETHNTVQVISDSLENMLDASKDSSSSAAVLSKNNLDSLQAQDGWVAKEASLFDPTTDVVIADDTMSTGDSSGTKENQTAILAYFDTLIYVGPRGLGVYLDSAAANTNTVLGTDGTSKNPVSTIAAAKTLATALGYNRYYFINASTFNDAANDLASSHQNWEFIGIANSNALAFGTQRVDESRFENMDLSGTMHASGGNVLYTNCTFGYITANFNGHAFNCLLSDTIVVKADVDIEFVRCQSDVGGNRTPTIDLSGGSSVVQLRAYSGGIRIMNGASNDTMSIETIGQVIISANNTSTNITVRGMLTLTDSGTTTNLTKDAVFSRAEADLWVWANADTAQPDSSELGVWLVNNLSGAAGGLDTLSTAFVDRLVGRNADTIWLSLLEARDGVAGSFGDSAQGWGATSASALDSGVVSRINHRVVWGTPQGSGSDSSTSAQRDIGVLNSGAISSGSFVAGAINANAIGSAAFTTAKFGTGFIQNASFADRALSLAKFDTATVAAYYGWGIWLDGAAANTNTTVGIDGTRANPVSTLAAARTLADSMGLQAYYLTNSSSFTLAATHEDWEFIGIGEGNLIDFGSQDIDGSVFDHLMISGTQGGTGMAGLHDCYLNTIDSLEAIVINSSFSDTISVRVSGNTVFDQCYSNVAGNNTPGLDFNSAGTINVSVRHYSGGLALFNGTSTHTISYESDGQLVIDASCTSINVTARGNMTITDNGTTTSLTADAVYNKGFVADTTLNTAEKDSILAGLFDKANATSSASLPFQNRMLIGFPDASPGWDTLVGNVMNDLNTLTLTQERIGLMVIPHVGTVNDAAPTVSQFVVSAGIGAYGDNFFDDLYLTFITGNLLGRTKRIVDFETTNDTIFVNSFFSAPANGDSFVVSPGNFDLARDSLFYQGAAAGLTAAGVWQYEIRDDTTDGAVDDTSAADHLYSASLGGSDTWSESEKDSILAALFDKGSAVSGGAIPFITRMILGFPNISPGWDSLSRSITNMIGLFTGATGEAGNIKNALDSLGQHIGQDGASTSRVSLHMKVGSYSGAAGDNNNIKDDIAAIAGAGGSGAYSCSIFVWDGASAITSGQVRMISGVNEYAPGIDANGWAVFSLDGGTWSAYATALRFIQDTIPQTITFSTHHVDTITMSAFSPSTPTDTGKVNLYIWTDEILGDTLEGAIFRVIPLDKGKNWVTGGNRTLLLGEVTKKTDSTGYAEIEVYQSSFTHPYPSGSDSLKYNISITYPGLSSWSQFRFVAPDSGNQYQIGVR